MDKKKILLPVMIVLMFSLVACGTSTNQNQANHVKAPVVNDSPEISQNQMSDHRAEDGVSSLSATEAYDLYISKYPDAKVEEIKLDVDSGAGLTTYQVEGYSGQTKYQLKISAPDGSVIKEETEIKDDHISDGEITKDHVEKVESLVIKAIEDVGAGASLDEWSLEFENGIAQLEVEVNVDGLEDIEYKYNLETGELLKKDY